MSGLNSRTLSGLHTLSSIEFSGSYVSDSLQPIGSATIGTIKTPFTAVYGKNLIYTISTDAPLIASPRTNAGNVNLSLSIDETDLYVNDAKLAFKPFQFEYPLAYEPEQRWISLLSQNPFATDENGLYLRHDNTLQVTEENGMGVDLGIIPEPEIFKYPLRRQLENEEQGVYLSIDNSLKVNDNHQLSVNVSSAYKGKGAIHIYSSNLDIDVEDVVDVGDVQGGAVFLKVDKNDFSQYSSKLSIRSQGLERIPFYNVEYGFNTDAGLTYNNTLNELHSPTFIANTSYSIANKNQLPTAAYVEQLYQAGSGSPIDIGAETNGRKLINLRTDATLAVDANTALSVNVNPLVDNSTIRIVAGKIASGLVFQSANGFSLSGNVVSSTLTGWGAITRVGTEFKSTFSTPNTNIVSIDNETGILNFNGGNLAGNRLTWDGLKLNVTDVPETTYSSGLMKAGTNVTNTLQGDGSTIMRVGDTLRANYIGTTTSSGTIFVSGNVISFVATNPLQKKKDTDPEETQNDTEQTYGDDPGGNQVSVTGPTSAVIPSIIPFPIPIVAPLALVPLGVGGVLAGALGSTFPFAFVFGGSRDDQRDEAGNSIVDNNGVPILQPGSNVAIALDDNQNATLFFDTPIIPIGANWWDVLSPLTAVNGGMLGSMLPAVIPNLVSPMIDSARDDMESYVNNQGFVLPATLPSLVAPLISSSENDTHQWVVATGDARWQPLHANLTSLSSVSPSITSLKIGSLDVATQSWVSTNYYNKTDSDGRYLQITDATATYTTKTYVDTSLATKQNLNASLSAIATLATTYNSFIVGTGSSFGLQNPTAVKATLNLGNLASISPAVTANNFLVANGGAWISTLPSAARSALGLSSFATATSIDLVNDTSGILPVGKMDLSSYQTIATADSKYASIHANLTSVSQVSPSLPSLNLNGYLTSTDNITLTGTPDKSVIWSNGSAFAKIGVKTSSLRFEVRPSTGGFAILTPDGTGTQLTVSSNTLSVTSNINMNGYLVATQNWVQAQSYLTAVDWSIVTSKPTLGNLSSISASPNLNNILVGDGSTFVSSTPASVRTALGLSTLATASSVDWSAITSKPSFGTLSSQNTINLATDTTGMIPLSSIDLSGYQPLLTAGTGLTKSGSTLSVNASQSQITSLGTLSSLTTSGTVTCNKLTSNSSIVTQFGNPTNNGTIANGNNGHSIQCNNFTLNDNVTASGGTASGAFMNARYMQPTISASNTSVTVNNAHNLYIDGPPIAGTNMTIANSYALYVSTGTTRLNALVTTGSSTLGGSLAVTGTSSFTGAVTVPTPTATGHATTKSYVDGISYITAGTGLSKTGSTLSMNSIDLGTSIVTGTLPSSKVDLTAYSTSANDAITYQPLNTQLSNISTAGVVTLSNATDATAYTNGSLILSGGLGIGKNTFINGTLDVAGLITGRRELTFTLNNYEPTGITNSLSLFKSNLATNAQNRILLGLDSSNCATLSYKYTGAGNVGTNLSINCANVALSAGTAPSITALTGGAFTNYNSWDTATGSHNFAIGENSCGFLFVMSMKKTATRKYGVAFLSFNRLTGSSVAITVFQYNSSGMTTFALTSDAYNVICNTDADCSVVFLPQGAW